MTQYRNVMQLFRLEKQLPSAQGMAIYGDELFQLYHTGYCAVHNMKDKNSKPYAFFPLGSMNEGTPNKSYINHSNQCMFSSIKASGNALPLMYVTSGNGIGEDEDGYFYRCSVENIVLRRDCLGKVASGRSELIQTICYKNNNTEKTIWEKPCWGCPAWFVDSENGYLYIFSCRNRTTIEFSDMIESNAYIISKFDLPDPFSMKKVVLDASKIIDQFTCPFDTLFTQGGVYYNSKLYYTFGLGNDSRGCYPNRIKVFNLQEKKCVETIDLSKSIMAGEEIESCIIYNENIYVNTNSDSVGIYLLLGI